MSDLARAVLGATPTDPGRMLTLDLWDPAIQEAFPDAEHRVTILPPGRSSLGFQVPWQPTDEPFPAAMLYAPKSRDRLRMLLLLVSSLVVEGGPITLVAPKRGAGGAMTEFAELGSVRKLEPRAHHKLASVSNPRPVPFRLTDWETRAEVQTPDGPLTCVWYPGVFAAGRLDEGTRLLLEHLPAAGRHGMDLGTGCGVVLAFLSRRGFNACGFDADRFAVEATARTIEANNGLGSTLGWDTRIKGHPQGDPEDACDLIASNPPFHAGLDTTTDAARALLTEAGQYLATDGQLIIVANRFLPYERDLGKTYAEVRSLADDGRFRVWSARGPL